jgi:hypothetical protein
MKAMLYFAHPITAYNTELEQKLLREIGLIFGGWEVVNPNEPKHEAGYKRRQMAYFLEEVLPSCSGVIVLPFRNGSWGAGIYKEAKFFVDNHYPVWTISHEGVLEYVPNLSKIVPLSVEETRAVVRTPDGIVLPY